jgi:hypothetical protein
VARCGDGQSGQTGHGAVVIVSRLLIFDHAPMVSILQRSGVDQLAQVISLGGGHGLDLATIGGE